MGEPGTVSIVIPTFNRAKLVRRAIDAMPTAWGAWNNLGNLLLQQRRFDEAAAAYARSIAGELDGAIADFSEAYAELNTRDHAAYVAAIEAGKVSVPPPAA